MLTFLLGQYNTVARFLRCASGEVIALSARLVFASTLLVFFWNSAKTKVGDHIFSPSIGAYYQVFPKKAETGAEFNVIEWLVVVGGTCAEFVLPTLLVLGLFTRLTALGMIGFVFVLSFVDIYGHEVTPVGAFFDGRTDGIIADLRLFWMFLLVSLVFTGGGKISLDAILNRIFGERG